VFTRVDHFLLLHLVDTSGPPTQVPGRLSYRRADPFAVQLAFPGVPGPGGGDLSWFFARELLARGLRTPSGDGDIRVVPTRTGRMLLRLRSSSAAAVLEADTTSVAMFLRQCEECVRTGEEHTACDWDGELAALLDQPAP
jgi:hypothetical protein